MNRRLLLLTFLGLLAPPALAHDAKVGAITIQHPYAPAMPGAAKTGIVYATIVNRGDADRIVGATALGARISAVLEVTPGQAGRNRILVEILGADGEALEARRVELVLAPAEPAAATPRLLRAARSAGGFAFADVDLPVAGRWTLRLEVHVSELELETLTTEVSIK